MKDVSELVKKVRRIEIKTRKIVQELFGGEYHSAFKGQGIEFSEVRQYQFGDDSRLIDWKVTARHNSPFVKVFQETRELNLVLLYDVSPSTMFGAAAYKRDIAGEIAAIITFSALQNNDKTALMLFSDGVERFIPPDKGRSHSLRIVSEILGYQGTRKKTDLKKTLREVDSFLKRSSIIFILSDFYIEPCTHELRSLARKHDVVGIQLIDPLEIEFMKAGIVPFEDPETGDMIIASTQRAFRRYSVNFTRHQESITSMFRKADSDLLTVKTDADYYPILMKFFKSRERKFR